MLFDKQWYFHLIFAARFVVRLVVESRFSGLPEIGLGPLFLPHPPGGARASPSLFSCTTPGRALFVPGKNWQPRERAGFELGDC